MLSYISVRRAIGLSGLLLPPALGPGGWLLGIPLQDNMSSYYYTPLRDVFVGTLCAIGVFLLCYRGHDWIENWTANLGCVSAIALALFPVDANSDPPFQHSLTGYIHTAAGAVFFLTLAFYSLVHFPRRSPSDPDGADLEDDPEDEPHVQQRKFVYRTSGVVILLAMNAMGVYLFLLPPEWRQECDRWNVLFWGEWIAVWAFAAAWLTKGRAIGADLAINLFAAVESQLPPALRPSEIRPPGLRLPGD